MSVNPNLCYSIRGQTDIGGGRTNQDRQICWVDPNGSNSFALGVFDGHSSNMCGDIAAQTSITSFASWFEINGFSHFHECPVRAYGRLFTFIHAAIKKALRDYHEKNGWTVQETPTGYLVKSKQNYLVESHIPGGTTGTIIVLLNGERLFTANVGDSDATLSVINQSGDMTPISQECFVKLSDLGTAHLHIVPIEADMSERQKYSFRGERSFLEDLKNPGSTELMTIPPSVDPRLVEITTCASQTTTLVITGDHSPESPIEFERMRRNCWSPDDPSRPLLISKYDGTSGMSRTIVFEDSTDIRPSEKGRYYKNVRNEWASLVDTPITHITDSLAFTRSLGDFHLQSLGLTFLPVIHEVKLSELFKVSGDIVTICCCTDGVWDNWKYDDFGKFIEKTIKTPILFGGQDIRMIPSSAQIIVDCLIAENVILSNKHFGSSSDNATAIVALLWANFQEA
jgi:serine/threonine protein phosphatase PrpC